MTSHRPFPRHRTRRALLLAAALLPGLALTGIGTASATHGGSDSRQLDVVGHLDLADVPGENITDVWAHGNYAYLGTFDDGSCSLDYTGVHIIDIADPADPEKVGFIPSPPGTRANDVKVTHLDTPAFSGDVLVYSNESCGSAFNPRTQSNGVAAVPGQDGVGIYDVTDPTNPRSLKRSFGDYPVHNTYSWQDGDNAYMIVVDDVNTQDVHIVDMTKPQSPQEIAVTGQLDWPAGIDNIGDGEVFLHDVWVQQNNGRTIAYLSYWDAGLVLLDVTNPAEPVFLGDSDYASPDPLSGEEPEGNGHVAVPNADGSRVLLGDEDFAAGSLNSFTFDGADSPAAEAGFTPPTYTLPGASFQGPVHWTGGEGCTEGEFDRPAVAGEVALIQRGSCFFSTKAANAQALGYAGFIVANNAGDGLITMSSGTNDVITIPGYFVGQSTGEAMKAAEGGTMHAEGIFDGYGYLRLLDVTDPGNIVELDQFATENVFANPPVPGDRTMHNVVVDEGTRAYISWYTEGMRVIDFSGDSLTEVAHFVDTAQGSNFWGVYLHDHPNGQRYILGSDRKTGLWIFADPA
ncbi:PA domain-containing protein [Saccharomonospora marina XMU15]|uniref:PA domain-containing protein n=1 Tax=Saccharomonospora marina XMU15 TaxID=882083 RepID=H5X7F5_9PSEU|nr:PA domain-containing protein [Saccharomonospora marina]EHR50174.1 PA domain-containing protein [Saccharomonospora marina XMU15]